MYNSELMRLAKQAAAELARQKQAVVPGGTPPGGGDPAAMGGAGAMPPGGDPAAMGAASPMDPALAQAGGDPTGMVQQIVQQTLAAQGGGAGKPGAAGPGKGGKPDVAMELAKLNDTVYKMGVILMSIAGTVNAPIPESAVLGPAPETSDPALAQAANTTPIPGTGDPNAAAGGAPAPGAAPGGAPAPGGAAKQAAEALEALIAGDDDVDLLAEAQKAEDRAAILKQARAVRDALGLNPEDGLEEMLDDTFMVEKVAAPATIGAAFDYETAGPIKDQHPLTLALAIRKRTLG